MKRFLAAAAWVLVAIAAPLVATAPAEARSLTATEQNSLVRAVARFDRAMRASDIPVIVDVVPPRVTRHMAAQAGIDHRHLRAAVIRQAREIMNSSVIRGFVMDMARARYGASANGSPYALIPTSTTVNMGGRDVTNTTDTLAMIDGGRWYLLDLNQPSRVAIFREVYPDFAGIPLGR